MKKQQVMALLLSSTLTIANVTPALAADISNVAVTSEVTQDAPADDATVVEETTETAPDVTENEETPADEDKNASEDTETPTDESANGQEESYTEEADNTVAQAAEQENQDAVQAADGESLPINSEFTENYLVYKVVGDKQVDVVDHDMWDETGDVVVNPTVEHDGVTYQVATVRKESFWEDQFVKTITFKMGVKNIESVFMGGAKNVSNVVIEDPEANMVVKDGCVYSSDMTRLEAMIPNYPMESYTTPDSVTVIGSRAIQSNTCKVVTLSDNVTTLENGATVEMPGTEVFNMGSGVVKMDNGQFYNCNTLKELNIKGSFMPGSEFASNCPNLEKVTIDGNIKGSLPNFFVNCPSLKAFDVINSTYQRSVDGVLFNGRTLMRYPAAKEDTSYYIPDGYSVTALAFNGCKNLKTLYVGNNVELKAGMVQDPSNAMDIYLLDKNAITFGTKSSYVFVNLPEGSNIYCANEDRVNELNAYDKVAYGTTPNIGVKKVAYESAAFTDVSDKEEISVGEEVQHIASKLTPNYANDDLVYTSSNEKICTVDAGNGTVKGVAEGDCEISVSSKESGKVLDSYTLHVSKVSVKSITLDKTELTLTLKSEPQKLKLTFDPVDSETTTGLTWESSDEKIVKVSKDGVVTAVGIGSSTITAKIQGKTAKCEVRVLAPLESIQLDKASADLKKGETVDLNVKVNPVYTTDDKTVTWKSSNTNVATVDKNGKVTAVGAGEATISATVGKFTETCKVTVSIPLEAIEMADKYNLELGAKEHLRPRANPINTTADLTKMKWTSSNPDVVKVDKAGNMTGVSYGTATITAELDGVKASCEVTVVKPGLDKAEVTLSQETYTYDGTEKRPKVTVKLEGKTLVEGKDYQVGYYDNVKVGTASVAIRAEGEQHGMIVKMFMIKHVEIKDATISGISNKTYNGSAQTQKITVKVNGTTLKEGTDYSVSYKNNTNAGTATVTITGKGNYAGTVDKTFQIAKVSINGASVSGITDKTYTGSAHGQNVSVSVSGKTLRANSDYTVSYSNNVNPGTATVTISGKGNYEGSLQRSFTIKMSGQWIQSGSRWWYRHNDGRYTRNGWEFINGQWYLFDNAGWMQTGWQKVGGAWYYMSGSGAMVTGWLNDRGTWYYMTESGAMATGWLYQGGSWYYLNPADGHMATGWTKVNGKWYYMNGSGKMLTGWQKVGGTWYYMDASGAMAENTWVGNYYVDGSGAWVKTR
ncbi:MAG: Ig-like domain-containing protein [Lachnospiraceae bacterium]